MAETVRGAAQAGEYASSSEIVREALRDWRHKRALQAQALRERRAKVHEGLAGIEAGRLHDLDAERIIEKLERDNCRAALLVVGRPSAPDLSVKIVVDTNVFVGACLDAGASNEVSAQCLRVKQCRSWERMELGFPALMLLTPEAFLREIRL